MNKIVASSITLFSIVPKDGSPNKSRWQRVSSSISLILVTSRPGTSESWSKRSLRSTSYRGQCRRKCLLFSLSLPQKQIGPRQSKACLKRCSFRALKCTRSFVNGLSTFSLQSPLSIRLCPKPKKVWECHGYMAMSRLRVLLVNIIFEEGLIIFVRQLGKFWVALAVAT